MRLLLMRHGETWANREARMQGQQDACLSSEQSCELSPQGQKQILALGQRLQATPPPSRIYASPLNRSRETLAILQATTCPSCDIHYDKRLSEIDLGILSGLTWPEAEAHYPELCQTLMRQSDWHPIPQAESLQKSHQRAQSFVEDCMADNPEDTQVWVISHAGILNYLISVLLSSDRAWGIPTAPAALFEFQLNRDRWHAPSASQSHTLNTALWQIIHFNDISHCPPQEQRQEQISPNRASALTGKDDLETMTGRFIGEP